MTVGALGGLNFNFDEFGYLYDKNPRHREKTEETFSVANQKDGYRDVVTGYTHLYMNLDVPYRSYYKKRSMDDFVLGNYKSLVAQGRLLPINDMQSEETEEVLIPTSFDVSTPKNRYNDIYRAHGEFVTWLSPNLFLPLDGISVQQQDDAMNRCIVKANANVDSGSVQALVSIGELAETVAMISGAAKTLVRLVFDVQHYVRKLARARSLPKFSKLAYKEAENAWMQVRFGWRPFYSEMGQLMEAAGGLKKFEDRQTFRAGESIPCSVQSTVPCGNTYVTGTMFRLTNEDYNVSSGILCTKRYGGFADTWGLLKLPEAIWELTPLSWCADYLFNFGKFIEAQTPSTLWSPELRWLTVRTRRLELINLKFQKSSRYAFGGASGGVFKRETLKVKRINAEGLPLKITAQPALSLAMSMDTFAVVRQRLTSFIRFIASGRRH